MGLLGDLADRYATLQQADELIPTSTGARGAPGFGSRSPAIDALIAHGDVRTKWTSELGYGALATIESWARLVREETGAAAPVGRVTLSRELATIRFHWDHVMAAPWLATFAGEVREVLHSLTHAGNLTERWLRVGPCPCPVMFDVKHPDTRETHTVPCGTTLRVRASDDEIRCQNCGTVWPRSRWSELGDQWTDYAFLSGELGVPVGTLRRWAHEDGWAVEDRGRRRLVSRVDALASYGRRRGGKAVA